MVTGRVMLGMIIAKVLTDGSPVDDELFLSFAELQPGEMHVHCFRPLLLDGVVGVTGGGRVAGLYGRWRLPTAEFFEGIAERDGFLAVDKEETNFGFSGGGHDVAEDVSSGMERSIVRWLSAGFDGWVNWFVAEIVVAASLAACFGLGKIGGITMDV